MATVKFPAKNGHCEIEFDFMIDCYYDQSVYVYVPRDIC